MLESYVYDADGNRVKKTVGSTSFYYPFTHYEISGTTVVKYYAFNGQRVAMKVFSILTYLHSDHLGSTVMETNNLGTTTTDEKYFAYGKQRDSGKVTTDHRFTGQKEDASGLQYFQARYYDPSIGTFVSPDMVVPQPGLASDYNRYAYANLNPLRFSDPTGHCIAEGEDGYDTDENTACWNNVNLLLLNWEENPEWWEEYFVSKENFMEHVANNPAVKVMNVAGLIGIYHMSDSYLTLHGLPRPGYTENPKPDPKSSSGCFDPISGASTTLALDGIGVGSALIVIVCLPAALECAGVSAVASVVGGTVGVVGAFRTVVNDESSKFDRGLNVTTALVGILIPKPVLSLAVNLIQTGWDVSESLPNKQEEE